MNDAKHAVDDITFMGAELEENGITEIESIEVSFHVFDQDSWENMMDTEPVTIVFE